MVHTVLILRLYIFWTCCMGLLHLNILYGTFALQKISSLWKLLSYPLYINIFGTYCIDITAIHIFGHTVWDFFAWKNLLFSLEIIVLPLMHKHLWYILYCHYRYTSFGHIVWGFCNANKFTVFFGNYCVLPCSVKTVIIFLTSLGHTV